MFYCISIIIQKKVVICIPSIKFNQMWFMKHLSLTASKSKYVVILKCKATSY